MTKEKKSWYKRWWAIILWILIGFGFIGALFGEDTPETLKQETQQQEQPKEISVVSKSFEDDFSILCDREATNLQKHDIFDKRLKDRYVEWSGEVSSISEGPTLQVKHCYNTLISDIVVRMKQNQKDKLMKYREGDQITYKAKLTRLGDILGLSATDGEVIENE